MIGMNATTGRAISGRDHLYQSIGKIIGTPTGSRLQRRRFGSDLFNLVDAPGNLVTRVRVYAAIAAALMRQEPRLQLRRVSLMRQEPRLQLRRVSLSDITQDGAAVFDIDGIATEDGAVLATSVTVPARGRA